MRSTIAGTLFALVGLAIAAPVPKTPSKLEDVFGEVADKKSECKFEMGKDGALTVTVPTTHPTLEPGSNAIVPPMVGKTVRGDFVLKVRITVTLPKAADVKGHTLQPAVMAGVGLVSNDTSNIGAVIGTARRLKGGEWTVADFHSSWEPLPAIKGMVVSKQEVEAKAKPGDPIWLRITRRGYLVEIETSGDGTTWAAFTAVKMKQLGDAVSVGPVAFGCIDQEFSVMFDQYEIKPLKKDEKK